jgi:hypothetical protein
VTGVEVSVAVQGLDDAMTDIPFDYTRCDNDPIGDVMYAADVSQGEVEQVEELEEVEEVGCGKLQSRPVFSRAGRARRVVSCGHAPRPSRSSGAWELLR